MPNGQSLQESSLAKLMYSWRQARYSKDKARQKTSSQQPHPKIREETPSEAAASTAIKGTMQEWELARFLLGTMQVYFSNWGLIQHTLFEVPITGNCWPSRSNFIALCMWIELHYIYSLHGIWIALRLNMGIQLLYIIPRESDKFCTPRDIKICCHTGTKGRGKRKRSITNGKQIAARKYSDEVKYTRFFLIQYNLQENLCEVYLIAI